MKMKDNFFPKYIKNYRGPLLHKWKHYFDIYESHLSKYRNKSPKILEIGVYHGGSLKMWKEYFGEGTKIFGVDINPNSKQAESKDIQIIIGDQKNRKFLKKLKKRIGLVDILIEDGGHTMEQQITTLQELYQMVDTPGTILIEDVHTSYWKEYGGGFRKKGTFIQYSKDLVDSLNENHIRSDGFFRSNKKMVLDNQFNSDFYSMSFYDSIVAIEKKEKEIPRPIRIGDKIY
ncbi:class I SAM-dependent methyltransferase [Candidatus Marinimicrobia bacterium]|jgi:hypothetical protein|nr:class I SAM-dependent methyltransferase [Candidatus Neomarinimicrobiota bacterium]